MSAQLNLATQANGGFGGHRKPTRRDVFPAEMDKVVPWAELRPVIEPFRPQARAESSRLPMGP